MEVSRGVILFVLVDGHVMQSATLDQYFVEIDRTPLLSKEEEKALARAIMEGDLDARDAMIRANLRLVVHIARCYTRRGFPLDDLIAEGNLGLIRAVELYDPDMNTRFSTYAAFWIKQSIKRHMQRMRAVPIPGYMIQWIVKINERANQIESTTGVRPNVEEVLEELEFPPKKWPIIKRAIKTFEATRLEDKFESSFFETLQEKGNSHQEASLHDEVGKALEAMSCLDLRSLKVVQMRYGLSGYEPMTLQQIGQAIGVTRERVRQLEVDALKELKKFLTEED